MAAPIKGTAIGGTTIQEVETKDVPFWVDRRGAQATFSVNEAGTKQPKGGFVSTNNSSTSTLA